MDSQSRSIREFYITNKPILLPNSRFRHYRLKTKKGFIKISKTIRKPEDLQKLCIKYLPEAVYQTNSYWVGNKGQLGKRKGRHPIFIGSSYVMDFDGEEESNENNIQKAIQFWKDKGCHHIIRVKTGRGYHIHCLDWLESNSVIRQIADPIKREFAYLKLMRQLAKTMLKAGIKFDVPISCDTRRLIRCPGCAYVKNNEIQTIIKIVPLDKFTLVPTKLGEEGRLSISMPSDDKSQSEMMTSQHALRGHWCMPTEQGSHLSPLK